MKMNDNQFSNFLLSLKDRKQIVPQEQENVSDEEINYFIKKEEKRIKNKIKKRIKSQK